MKNWSLSKKIWSVIGILALAFLGSSGLAYKEFIELREMVHDLTGKVVRRDQLIAEMKMDQRRFLILAMEIILQPDPNKRAHAKEKFDYSMRKQDEHFKEFESICSDEERVIFEKYKSIAASFFEAAKTSNELALQFKDKDAVRVLASVEKELDQMRDTLEGLHKVTSTYWTLKSEEANSKATRSANVAALTSSISICITLALAFLILRSVTQRVGAIVNGLSKISIQVTSTSSQIASISNGLSQATTEQAAALEETAASVEELNSMVAKNSENAHSTARTSTTSQQAVFKGQQVVQKMMESMDAIHRSSEGVSETVKMIEQIDKKTKVINEIVNKTELLSFNASVEAARAGEHGKGFAVVAEEVGNLARLSGTAAEEITSLLEESLKKVHLMVAEIKKNVETGTSITKECGHVFEQVVQNVSSVTGMANEIASASQEQARGCTEITKTMNQLDQMTQKNANTSEECATAAETLASQSQVLKQSIHELTLTVNGFQEDQDVAPGAAPPFESTMRIAS